LRGPPPSQVAIPVNRTRRGSLALKLLLAAIPAMLLVVVVVNLTWFDEALIPELDTLRKPQRLVLEGNAFPSAMGFLAAKDRDPRVAGLEIIRVLQAHRDRGEPAIISKEEKRGILGEPLTTEGLARSRPETKPSASTSTFGQVCLPRYRLDCAQRLISDVAELDPDEPTLSLLLSRYDSLLQQERYVETPAPDPMTPWPPLGPIQELARVRLAISFRTEPTAVFLEKVTQDLRFWRMTLRDGQLLGTKMSALSAIRWAHDFVAPFVHSHRTSAT
jgi:hypothetical protein